MIPILFAEVRDTEGGSRMVGSFRLHPFAKFLPWFSTIVLLGIAGTVWFESHDIRGWLFAIFFLLMAFGAALFAFQERGPRVQEEEEIRQFLEKVLLDVR